MNTISYNLAAHIHMLGSVIPRSQNQRIPFYTENVNLTLPADVSASGFYITNVNNTIVGNAASGVSFFMHYFVPLSFSTFRMINTY